MSRRAFFFLIGAWFFAASGFAEETVRADFLGKTESFRQAHAVFERSCLPCHSGQVPVPWYGRLPGVQSRMKREYREAIEGLNFDTAVYIAGQAPSAEALDKIEAVILDGSMPPRLYRMRHWSASISKDEKKTILDWIAQERQSAAIPLPVAEPEPALEEKAKEVSRPFNPFKPFDS